MKSFLAFVLALVLLCSVFAGPSLAQCPGGFCVTGHGMYYIPPLQVPQASVVEIREYPAFLHYYYPQGTYYVPSDPAYFSGNGYSYSPQFGSRQLQNYRHREVSRQFSRSRVR